jgi:hypothetical protein
MILDTIVIPAVMGSLDPKKNPAFLLNLLKPADILNIFDAALKSAQEQSSILLIPRIDHLWIWVRQKHVEGMILRKLEESRGKNLTILATAVCNVGNLPEHLQQVFEGRNRSFQLRKPNEEERHRFFWPLFNPEAEFHDGARPADRAVLKRLHKAAVQDTTEAEIRKILTLHGELAHLANNFVRGEDDNHPVLLKSFEDILRLYEQTKLSPTSR